MVELIFGGAYLRRKICVSKSIGLALYSVVGSKFTVFALLYFVFGGYLVQAPGGLIFGGVMQRRGFCVTSLGGLYLEGLTHGGAYFRNFTVCLNIKSNDVTIVQSKWLQADS